MSHHPLDTHALLHFSSNFRCSFSLWKLHCPDHLNILHLKHLGLAGVQYLTSLVYFSRHDANLPSIWKSAIIIPHTRQTSIRMCILLIHLASMSCCKGAEETRSSNPHLLSWSRGLATGVRFVVVVFLFLSVCWVYFEVICCGAPTYIDRWERQSPKTKKSLFYY